MRIFRIKKVAVFLLLGECTHYTNFSSVDRAVGYDLNNGGIFQNELCDDLLNSSWYRFTDDAGTQMPDTCVRKFRCGTFLPGWINGTHPKVQEGRVTRRVCFSYFPSSWWYRNGCCVLSQTVLVRNCSDFYVYWFNAVTASMCGSFCGNNVNGKFSHERFKQKKGKYAGGVSIFCFNRP